MEDGACDAGALAETVVFLSHFDELPDDRQAAKVRYPLDEVLLLCLLAVIAGAEAITDRPPLSPLTPRPAHPGPGRASRRRPRPAGTGAAP